MTLPCPTVESTTYLFCELHFFVPFISSPLPCGSHRQGFFFINNRNFVCLILYGQISVLGIKSRTGPILNVDSPFVTVLPCTLIYGQCLPADRIMRFLWLNNVHLYICERKLFLKVLISAPNKHPQRQKSSERCSRCGIQVQGCGLRSPQI